MKALLESLAGELAASNVELPSADTVFQHGGLGHSQLNELLLSIGFDRVEPAFFQFLLNGTTSYEPGASFNNEGELIRALDRFHTLAMLRFGNIKYAFKFLSQLDSATLTAELDVVAPIPVERYRKRHSPILKITPIPAEKTYLLGYIIEKELNDRLQQNPADAIALAERKERDKIVAHAKQNHDGYLTSDHMDVYVATSMRRRHEFLLTANVCAEIFAANPIIDLNLRYFDPTQAYCANRIDKGLCEGLMLKRAKCTVYLLQESDTLGKDSELAATLAQGKPVIAYIPKVKKEDAEAYAKKYIEKLSDVYPDKGRPDLILEQLQILSPNLAWTDNDVRDWCKGVDVDEESMMMKLAGEMRENYDRRADTLKERHPLGLQVNLETGVANGVLVARSVDECARLIRDIMLRELEFDVDRPKSGPYAGFLLLREKRTQSIYRAVTPDRMLTNAFWNFYLD